LGYDVPDGKTPVFSGPPETRFSDLSNWLSCPFPLRPRPTADTEQALPNTWRKIPIGPVSIVEVPGEPTPVKVAPGWEAQPSAWSEEQLWDALSVQGRDIVPDKTAINQPFIKTEFFRDETSTTYSLFTANREAYGNVPSAQANPRPETVGPAKGSSSSKLEGRAQMDSEGVSFTEPIAASSTDAGMKTEDTNAIGSPGFQEMSEKPQFITAFEWEATALSGDIIQTISVPEDLLVTSVLSVGFSNNVFQKWDSVRFIITIQGSMFLQGMLRAFVAPLMTTGVARARYSQNLRSVSLVQGVDMRPGGSNTWTIDVPWMYPKNYTDIRKGSKEFPFFVLGFYVVDGILTGPNAIDRDATVTVSAGFMGAKYQIPQHVPLPASLRPENVRRRVQFQGRPQGLNEWISAIFGRETVDFEASMGPMKLKFDKPVVGTQPLRITRQDRQYNAQGINPMYANVMAHDTGARNMVGVSAIPQMLTTTKDLWERPTYLGRFSIKSTDMVGDVLWDTLVGPGAATQAIGSGEDWSPTLAEYVAHIGTQWRGSLKYKFVALGSKQTFRLAFTPNFNSSSVVEDMTDAMSQYAVVAAFSEVSQECEVVVPFLSDTDRKYVAKGYVSDTTHYFTGTLAARVYGRLQTPETCASQITVLIYLSFGEDFEIFDISAGPADWLSSSRPLASKAPILQRATKKYGGGA